MTVQLSANKVLGVGEGITSDGKNIYTRANSASNSITVQTAIP